MRAQPSYRPQARARADDSLILIRIFDDSFKLQEGTQENGNSDKLTAVLNLAMALERGYLPIKNLVIQNL